jgi:hypothetical protein
LLIDVFFLILYFTEGFGVLCDYMCQEFATDG